MSFDPEKFHNDLYSETPLLIGKIHWYLVRAETELYNLSFIENEDQTVKETEFGRAVGQDVMSWWINKMEKQHQKLALATQKTLDASQKLKEEWMKFRDNSNIMSYPDLISGIKKFLNLNKSEIEVLYEYVLNLHKKNLLAPTILFSYRVWGTSRRSDRQISIKENTPEENQELFKRIILIAFGLATRDGLTLDESKVELADEVSNYTDGVYPKTISIDQAIYRTIGRALERITQYFELLRDSLRNILIEITLFIEKKNLLSNTEFLTKFIEKIRIKERVENQLWDFKQTLPMWYTTGDQKHHDEIDFCEQIASYSNKDGGVLIIGISNSDRKVVGIEDLENKIKFTTNVLGRYLEYPKDFVKFQQLRLKDKSGKEKDCLIIEISQTSEVVAVNDDGKYSYPIRENTGLKRESLNQIESFKKSIVQDNFNFILEIEQITNQN
ncbi:MAG: ATP-binding protein [Candidatus Paceibacterota bacterium]